MKGGPGIAIILGMKNKKGKDSEKGMDMEMSEEESMEDTEISEGKVAAASEIISAMKSENERALAESLKNFVKLCMAEYGDNPGSENEEY